MNQDGVIWFVNRHTELLFGYAREDLIGRQVEMLVMPSWSVVTITATGSFTDTR